MHVALLSNTKLLYHQETKALSQITFYPKNNTRFVENGKDVTLRDC
jgi:hypothetical protein